MSTRDDQQQQALIHELNRLITETPEDLLMALQIVHLLQSRHHDDSRIKPTLRGDFGLAQRESILFERLSEPVVRDPFFERVKAAVAEGFAQAARGEFASEGVVERARERALQIARDPFFEGVKADIAEGLAELDRGEGIPAEEAMAKVRERIYEIGREMEAEEAAWNSRS